MTVECAGCHKFIREACGKCGVTAILIDEQAGLYECLSCDAIFKKGEVCWNGKWQLPPWGGVSHSLCQDCQTKRND